MEPDDVIIADIGDQALNIFLHGPQSAHKNGIVKTNIRSHMHSTHPCTLLKQKKSKPLNSPNMTPSFTGPLPVQCAGELLSGSLADAPQGCFTSEASSPRTVLIENICKSVQQILRHMVPAW